MTPKKKETQTQLKSSSRQANTRAGLAPGRFDVKLHELNCELNCMN